MIRPRWRMAHRHPLPTVGWGMVAGLMLIAATLAGPEVQARQTEQELNVHAQRVMIRGLTWLQNGYPDRAAAIYAEGLKVHADNGALLAAMAQAQQSMGDLGTARFYLDQALERSPDVPALVEQDLDLALASGDLNAAGAAVERMLHLESVGSHFMLRQLSTLLSNGSASLGRDLVRRSLDLFPDDADVTAAAFSVQMELGDQDAIIATAQRLVALRGSYDDRMVLARALMRNGMWNEAVVALEPLILNDASDPELIAMMSELDGRIPDRDLTAELGIALTLTERSRTESVPSDSLSALRAAWEERPEEEDRVVALAAYLMRAGNAREAALLVDEHNAAYPRHLRVWTLTIQTWLAAGDLETALQRAEDAALLFPGYAPIVMAHAEVLAAQGASAEAVQMIDALLDRLDPDDAHVQTARALKSRFQQPQ